MDRRRFLQVSAALTAGLALPACTSEAQQHTEPQATETAEPRIFRFAQAAQVLSLDPARTNRVESHRITAQILEPLVQADSNTGEPVASLAKNWDISKDGLTYTFTLEPDLHFSNGDPCTADAVMANVTRWRTLSAKPLNRLVQPYHQLFAQVTGGGQPLVKTWEARDQHTLVVTLSRTSTSFLKALTQPNYRLLAPTSIGQDGYLTDQPIGTGPFALDSWDGSTAVLRALPDHRSPVYGLDRIEFTTVPSPEKRYYHLLNGDIDAYDQVALKDYVPLALDGYPVQSRDPYAITYLALNLAHPAFKDVRARQALAHALNRGKIVGDNYPQGSTTANDFVPSLFQVKNEDSADVYKYDIKKAKELLRSSIYANQEIKVYYPIDVALPALPAPERIYAALSADLIEAGFNIVPAPYKWNDAASEDIFTSHKDTGIELTGFVGDFRDPSAFLNRVLAPAIDAPDHLTATPSPAPTATDTETHADTDTTKVTVSYNSITQAIQEADSLDTVEQRREAYRLINGSMAEYLCAVPLAFPVSGVVSSKRVSNYIVNATCLDDYSAITVTP